MPEVMPMIRLVSDESLLALSVLVEEPPELEEPPYDWEGGLFRSQRVLIDSWPGLKVDGHVVHCEI